MKKTQFLFCFYLFIVTVSFASAQSNYNNQTATTFPKDGKYEIITSPLTMRDTYLLNKETGETWQLTSSSYGYYWNKLSKDDNPKDIIPEGYTGAVYQITMSGIAAKGTYLTNTLTGATWMLMVINEDYELGWSSISLLE